MGDFFREPKRDICFRERINLNYPPHVHDDIEFVYMKKGSVNAFLNGEKYSLVSNNIFIVFPNQVHYYTECSNDCLAYLLIINPHTLLKKTEVFKSTLPVVPVLREQSIDNSLVSLIELSLKEAQTEGNSDIVCSLLTALFLKLINSLQLKTDSFENSYVSKILQYCGEHFKEAINIEQISSSLNISRSYISHIFSEKLKVSFCEYINSLRLIEAVRLLRSKNLSITEISYLSGFPTIRTFNRVFFNHYKMSPSEYRKENMI